MRSSQRMVAAGVLLLGVALIPAAFALAIELSVTPVFSLDLFYLETNASGGPVKFVTEVFNNGSLAYRAQARIDVRDAAGASFTTWSASRALSAGTNSVFKLFVPPLPQGNHTARVRIYYNGEVMDREFSLLSAPPRPQEGNITIQDARAYHNHLRFVVTSLQDAGDVAILPLRAPAGWIIPQVVIPDLKAGETRVVLMRFDPAVRGNDDLTLAAFSTDGRAAGTADVSLTPATGLSAAVHDVVWSLLQRS